MVRSAKSALIAAALFAASGAQASSCADQVKHSAWALAACLRDDALWRHLQAFAAIANAHPDALGHGNRDTFTPGYAASVDYVARTMREAGYQVTIAPYDLHGRTDYNVIAESRFGDPNHIVVLDAHLDSIFGAGILDNASGSATILEIAR